MSFVIMDTFLRRIEKLGAIELKNELFREMIQFKLVDDVYTADELPLNTRERPPMIDIPEYRKKFYPESL
jgi:glucosyl-3-phosphoglycerate synthase